MDLELGVCFRSVNRTVEGFTKDDVPSLLWVWEPASPRNVLICRFSIIFCLLVNMVFHFLRLG